MREDNHPVHWITTGDFTTFSGKLVNIHKPKPEMICIEDIAHALSNICRFNGHTPRHYSVAQHSIFVSNLMKQNGENVEMRLHGLMHDAAEAYIQDIIKPLKHILGGDYASIEHRFEMVICERFGLDMFKLRAVKNYDLQAIEIEYDYFFNYRDTSNVKYGPNEGVGQQLAETAFKGLFNLLMEVRNANPKGITINGEYIPIKETQKGESSC